MMPINQPSWGTAEDGYQQPSSTLLGMNEDMTARAQQIFQRENLRGGGDFFGGFSVVLAPPQLMERARHNLRYFFLNYMVLTAAVFCATLLVSPRSIIGIAVLGAMWIGVSRLDAPMQVQRVATGGMALLSAWALYYLLSGAFWWALYSSAFLILCHVIFRDSSGSEVDYSPNYQYSSPGDAVIGQV